MMNDTLPIVFFDIDNNTPVSRNLYMIDKLEEMIGEIKSPSVKNSIETVLTRLVLIGTMPDEAIEIVRTIWECTIEDCYSPFNEVE